MITQLNQFFLKNVHFKKDSIDVNIFNPKESSDTLFGCFYILTYGIVEYEKKSHMMNTTHENQLKFKCINHITHRKLHLGGISKGLPEFHYENTLGNNIHIDLHTFFGLCYAYDVPVAYIQGNKYYYTSNSHPLDINHIHVLTKSGHPTKPLYCIHQANTDSIQWNELYRLVAPASPLPPVQTMSKSTLLTIIERFYTGDSLGIVTKYTKKQLYECAQGLLKLI